MARVNLSYDSHGEYALSDLILELSHFLDEDVINKVQLEIVSNKLRNEWNLSQDFKLVETRNKEISLVINELEEVMYRLSGMFDENDFEYIKKFLSLKRNLDSFDKVYYELDMKSLKEFMEDANFYDDRI